MRKVVFKPKLEKMKLNLSVLAFLIMLNTQIQAQITIGSTVAPIPGALLELKEEGTTTKGLLLPRVKLTDATDITVDISGVTSANADDHIGLTIYSTEVFGINPVNCPGPYVWNGEQWQPLIPKETKPEITMEDADGNIYVARWFGYDPCDNSIGAYWTVSNLYTATKGSGGAFTSDTPRLNPALKTTRGGAIDIPYTGIPAGTIAPYGVSPDRATSAGENITGQSYADFAKTYGLLYSYSQASEACPTGWHLPSKAEWENLISGQGGYELCIAKLRKEETWKWYYTSVYNSNFPTELTDQWGENDGDTQPVPSGFDALPSGYSSDNNDDHSAFGFGAASYYWSSDRTLHDMFYQYTDMIEGDYTTLPFFVSVRCVKD
jgi:uncharacterized protein (TIGR02145 family)